METIAEKLELLRRTKERQKAYLQQKYPLLDFDTIPFRAYLDLFQGRSYVPGLVAAWKTYGKRNDDADRDDLYDYSGNGRDIELFNFAFAGMSGYGGYPYNFNNCEKWGAASYNSISSSRLTFNAVTNGITFALRVEYITNRVFKAKLKVSGYDNNVGTGIVWKLRLGSDASGSSWEEISSDGVHEVEYTIPEDATVLYIQAAGNSSSPVELSSPIYIDLLPDYPGALVSDGVDDYGQCIKDLPVFTKETGYTVLAIRKILNNKSGTFLTKLADTNTLGAFVFEIIEYSSSTNTYSFGATNNVNFPELFSYQTSSKYNSEDISMGDLVDGPLLYLFRGRDSYVNYSKIALYDLRIYDHSLTAEELQTVKDEMMSDFENATGGGIADITYVADWDAKGRSNDEEADVRSQWTDKATGKVINLSNYSFSKMSGWGGYNFDFTQRWQSDNQFNGVLNVVKNERKAIFTLLQDYQKTINFYVSYLNDDGVVIPAQTLRVRSTKKLAFSYGNESGNYIEIPCTQKGDIYTVEIPDCKIFLIFIKGLFSSGESFAIEQLPLYPGALVSDGVDDYGKSADIIDDEIGTVLASYCKVSDKSVWHYLMNCGVGEDNRAIVGSNTANRYYVHYSFSPESWPLATTRQINASTRLPAAANDNLYVAARSKTGAYDNVAIFRLILIKEQLDDSQVEFLKWKVEKEYQDWCRANGYDYAIPEMTSATN